VETQILELIHRSRRNAAPIFLSCGKLFAGCGKGVEKKSKSCGLPVESMGKTNLTVKFCKVLPVQSESNDDLRIS
jgi:hypothetical protein